MTYTQRIGSFLVLGAVFFGTTASAEALSVKDLLSRLERYRSVQKALTASAGGALSADVVTEQATLEAQGKIAPKSPAQKELLPPGVDRRVFGELKKVSGGNSSLFTKAVKYGATRSDDVRKLQVFLIAKGYLEAEPTGVFGRQTRDALRKFQADKGIKGDGTLVGPSTRAAIEQDIATYAEEVNE